MAAAFPSAISLASLAIWLTLFYVYEDACELDTGKNVDDNGRVRQLELHVSIGGGYTSLTCLNRRDVVTSTVTGDGVTQLTLYPNRRALH